MSEKQVVLTIKDVSKNLGGKNILSGINLDVKAGEVVGIIGTNGSGKTTLLRMIMGLMYPTSGEISIGGRRVYPGLLGSLPINIGALIESPSFLPQFSGLQNLRMLAEIRNQITLDTIYQSMEKVGLDPKNRKPVSKYSLGMKQRLGIAQAIMENPEIILFDEPTNGLDSEGVAMFFKLVNKMTENGTSFIIVSHNKEDIDRLCHTVYQIENGLLANIRIEKDKSWKVIMHQLTDLEKILKLTSNTSVIQRVNDKPTVVCKGAWSDRQALKVFLREAGIGVIEIEEYTE